MDSVWFYNEQDDRILLINHKKRTIFVMKTKGNFVKTKR